MEVHPISDATFAHGHKVRVYSNFASLFSVMKETLCIFLAQTLYTLDKKSPYRSEIFIFLTSWLKIHQIHYVIVEITSQFFFKLCISLQCHERFCTFLAENLYDLDKRSPSKCKISDFYHSREISPNLHFDGLLLLKVYKNSAKSVQRSYVS